MYCGAQVLNPTQYDRMTLTGTVEIIQRFYRVRDRRGRFITPRCLRTVREKNTNLVTLAGRTFFCSRARANNDDGPLSHYALGTDSTPPSAIQTTLVVEAYRGLLTRTKAFNGQLELTLHLGRTQGNGVTYKEGGPFNAASGGVMAARVTFSDKVKTNTNTLTVIHTITLTSS